MIAHCESHQCLEEFEIAAERMAGLLARLEPISLSEMDSVALLNRSDTKYVMRVSQLVNALPRVGNSRHTPQLLRNAVF